MGQTSSTQTPPNVTQRIKPTPGTAGTRIVRKNTVSVYSESNNQIFTLKVTFDMTISHLKQMLPGEKIQLMLDDKLLPNSGILQDLGISEQSLLRIVSHEKISDRTTSTVDSISDSVFVPKIIGPKREVQAKPTKPNCESILSSCSSIDGIQVGINLPSLAVPDVTLKRSYEYKSKKTLY
ncbi:unnamed protein product [Blepharisma stoltei]|uniref:Ubiquitin-like domain-containing protein n=1 Tax=Blepharisma stoltei TaxID=1481888 RepID=A0AAU9ICP3_9CILI|nr:unnamed protein product [Blepharisma stoltei]